MAIPGVTSALPITPLRTVAAVNCPAGWVHPKDWDGSIDDASCCPGTGNPSAMECLLSKYINPVINLLSAGIGVAIVISLVAAGIQYSGSAGDPGKVSAAKQRIFNALLALAGFIFLYAFLQWVVPGGLL